MKRSLRQLRKAEKAQKRDDLILAKKLRAEKKRVEIPIVEPTEEVANQLTEEWKEENKKNGGKTGRPPQIVQKKIKEERERELAEARVRERQKAMQAVKQKELEFVSPKLAAWIEEFGKNGGNATKAAIAIGSYSSYGSAVSAGGIYLKRAIELGMLRSEMEKKGYPLGAMISVMLRKMEEAKGPEWWDRAMKMYGIDSIPGKNNNNDNTVQINVIQTQQKIQDEFGFAEEGEVVDTEE